MSYEEVNVRIRGFSTPISVYCTNPFSFCGIIMPSFPEKGQRKMQICHWALLWVFILCASGHKTSLNKIIDLHEKLCIHLACFWDHSDNVKTKCQMYSTYDRIKQDFSHQLIKYNLLTKKL